VLAGTRGLVCNKAQSETHTSIQVQPEQSGIPCAVVLRLIPCSPWRRIPFASIAGGLKILRSPVGIATSPPGWHQPRVPEPHGFAVRRHRVRRARLSLTGI